MHQKLYIKALNNATKLLINSLLDGSKANKTIVVKVDTQRVVRSDINIQADVELAVVDQVRFAEVPEAKPQHM